MLDTDRIAKLLHDLDFILLKLLMREEKSKKDDVLTARWYGLGTKFK